jgi:hypothetical protein
MPLLLAWHLEKQTQPANKNMILLNLISPDYKKIIKKNFIIKNVKNIFLYITLFVVIINITLLSAKKLLMDNFIKTVDQSTVSSTIPKDNNKIRQINRKIATTEIIQTDYIAWSRLLIYFSSIIPDDVLVNSIAIIPDLKNEIWKVKFIGNANNREAFLKLKENMTTEKSILENAQIPLDNLFKKDNIDFQIDFDINKKNLINLPIE